MRRSEMLRIGQKTNQFRFGFHVLGAPLYGTFDTSHEVIVFNFFFKVKIECSHYFY